MLQAEDIKRLISIWAAITEEKRDYLITLDSVVGDGDLGLTMSDGFRAAKNAAYGSDEADIGKLLYFSGKAMSEAVPSTMGTLMASGLMQAGKALKGVPHWTRRRRRACSGNSSTAFNCAEKRRWVIKRF